MPIKPKLSKAHLYVLARLCWREKKEKVNILWNASISSIANAAMNLTTAVTSYWWNDKMIIMDGERNHSMGSPMDGTPPQSEDR